MKTITTRIFGEVEKTYYITFMSDHKDLQDSLTPYLAKPFLMVTDENVLSCHEDFFKRFKDRLLVLKPGEATKSLQTIETILNKGFELGLNRESHLIAVGGGVVGDSTGFAASIFMRGIAFVQVPTTLLSMVDASIGGKTGVDSPYGKNLIGSFHQPSQVLINSQFLDTLPEIEIKNGLCEMIKHGILGSESHFEHLETLSQTDYQLSDIIKLIPESIEVKRSIVESDEKEMDIRGHLNLGHTYGHAIEHLSHYQIPHGQAVGIGCVLAAEKALEIGWIDEKTTNRIETIFTHFKIDTKNPYPLDEVFEAMKSDKKVKDGKIRLILPQSIGKVDYHEIA